MSDQPDTFSAFWEHVEELRSTLIKCLAVIACGMLLSFCFYDSVLSFFTSPLHQSTSHTALQHHEIRRERIFNPGKEEKIFTLPPDEFRRFTSKAGTANRSVLLPPNGYVDIDRIISSNQLLVLSPLEGMLISLKVSFWLGLLGTSPVWLYFLLKFISPALHTHERKLLYPFVVLSFAFVLAGLGFAFFGTIPLANQYLQAFNSQIGVNLWSLGSYIDYTLFLLLANAFAFELGLALLFLVHFGMLKAEWMASKRRHMIVVAFILGAILTPPDVLTQLMLAIPLIGLYELAIVYAKVRTKKETKPLKAE